MSIGRLNTTTAADSPHKEFGQATAPLGRIISVSGAQAVGVLDNSAYGSHGSARAEMGMLVRVHTPVSVVIGMVSGLSVPLPSHNASEPEMQIAELELLGEFARQDDRLGEFRRGVSVFPTLSDPIFRLEAGDLERIYSAPRSSNIRIGAIHQDKSLPAFVITDQLLGKHFAVLGTTGSGKSCCMALILRGILEKHPNAHVVLLDPHNEYHRTFQGRAEVITPEDLQLPYWLLTFEEILEVMTQRGGDREAEAEILYELIPLAKKKYAASAAENADPKTRRPRGIGHFTVDTPVPYRMSDLMAMIDEIMGRLNRPQNLAPYRRLANRIETIMGDARYQFMFGSVSVRDTMTEVLSRIFRIPVDGRPITIVDLSGIPSEVLNVVVSVLARMTFDLALWSGRSVPILLVCEEAHRYVPQDPALGFEPAKNALSKIAKEGRKYGVSLAVVSQRPSDLDPTILSQCSTIFAMRLTNQRDQDIIQATVTDAGRGLLEFLPSLGDSEAITIGEGVTLPVRISFDSLPPNEVPRSSSTRFSEQWNTDVRSDSFLDRVVERWRMQQR